MIYALKPGGMIAGETYTREHLKYLPRFPRQFLLEPNELLHHFADMLVLHYRITDDGQTAFANILSQKP